VQLHIVVRSQSARARSDACGRIRAARHCPFSVSTLSQALLSRPRCCFRQASTTESPSFITARQKRETSRAQASCPCRCADAPEAIKKNGKAKGITKRNLNIGLCPLVMMSARSNALKPAPQRLYATREIACHPGRGEPGTTGRAECDLRRPRDGASIRSGNPRRVGAALITISHK
jgi:hypothetical protein